MSNKELTFPEIVKSLIKGYKVVFLVLVIGVSSMALYNAFATPTYKSKCSFFIPTDSSQPGGIAGYAQLIGVNLPSNLNNYISGISESDRIRALVAQEFVDEFNGASIGGIIANLNLKKKFSLYEDHNGIFWMSYIHQDPVISQKVLAAYLEALLQLNKELEITSQKDIITILDAPSVPDYPFSPNKVVNMVVAIIGSLFLGISGVILREFYLVDLRS